jgi:hypothetical protein
LHRGSELLRKVVAPVFFLARVSWPTREFFSQQEEEREACSYERARERLGDGVGPEGDAGPDHER